MLYRVAVQNECLLDPSEMLLGIFTAMPFNIFFTLANAHASAYFLGSYYDAIFYFMVAATTLFSAGGLFSRYRLGGDRPTPRCF